MRQKRIGKGDFVIELNKIYNEDCLEGMKRIPDKSIDMILTDPPYMMNYQSNRRKKENRFDKIHNDVDSFDLVKDALENAYRMLKEDSAIYMFCSWHNVDFFKVEFEKYFKLKNIIVWNKNNHGSGDLKASYAPKYEFVLYGNKGRSLFREKRIPDVIDCAKVPSGKMTHPTEKPVELLAKFIRNSSDEGGVVLDMFAGTGATAIAAINTNRNFIGFELDKNYFDIANERIKLLKG